MPKNSIPVSTQNNQLTARLLIIDDEPDIRSGLTRMLNLEGYVAEEASSGYEAMSMLERYDYDLVVLDLRLPGMGGMAAMQNMRRLYPDLLIVVLTGHATLESAITTAKTDMKADYLLKPAHNSEVIVAVVKALKKQAEQLIQQRLVETASQLAGEAPQSDSSLVEDTSSQQSFLPELPDNYIQIAPFLLDRKRCRVTINNEIEFPVELSKGETAVLASLMALPNQTLSCRKLVKMAWGDTLVEFEAASVIRPYISRLRQKLEPNPGKPRIIRTVRQRGYCFTPVDAL